MSTAMTPEHVTLTINGQTIKAPYGSTILEAARQAGIEIPTLCQHGWVHPMASCRICVVKVEGVDDVVASCSTPAMDGMVVITHDDELLQLRRQQMEFILLNHPLDCPVCDKAGECRLQDLTYMLGVEEVRFAAHMPEQIIDKNSPLIQRHDARCVRCGRCVAVCYEVMAVGAYRFNGRGYASRIDTQDGGPLDCEFCGQCVAVCPVGALLSKQFLHSARVWELQKTPTTCGYCGAGCQFDLNTRRNRVHRITSDAETTSNHGWLCVRGRFGYDFIHDSRRPSAPVIRRNGVMTPVSWNEALDTLTEGLNRARNAGGPEAIGVVTGPRLPIEDIYLAHKLFSKNIGARHVALAGQDGYGAALRVIQQRLDWTGSTATFDDLAQSDCLLLLGSDLAAEMPVPHLAVLRAVRESDAKLICAYPVPSKLEDYASTKLRYRPGEELAVLLSILRCLLDIKGQNIDFIMRHTEGFAAFNAKIEHLPLDELIARSGLSSAAVQKAAKDLAGAKRPVLVLGHQALNSPLAAALTNTSIDLLMVLGRVEKGLLLAAERCNVQGGMLVRTGETSTYADLLQAGSSGKLNALFILGADPLLSAPQAELLRKAMEVTGFVVATGPFFGATAQMANIFLPTVTFAERNGTYISAERRVLSIQKAIEAKEGAWPEWRILTELAQRLGHPVSIKSPSDLWPEIAESVPDLKNIKSHPLPQSGIHLPRFGLNGEQKIEFGALPEMPAPLVGEMILVTGPILFHNGSLSHWASGPREACAEPWIALHPNDAARLGLAAGDMVKVRADSLELGAPLKIDGRLTPGTAFTPLVFEAFPVNRLLDRGPAVRVKIYK